LNPVRDLVISPSPLLEADLYLPERTGPAPPVIVWLHAGGWRMGSRRVAPDLSRWCAARGFAMAAVDYRLSDRATFPAQIQDVKTAVRWLRTVAGTYGFDGSRIGLWGSSAGAHLAALAGLTGSGTFEPPGSLYGGVPSEVQAVVAGYPPIDFLQLDAHRPPRGTPLPDPEARFLPNPDMRAVDPDSFESLLLGAPIESCPDRVRAANPLTYAGAGAPPFLIAHGTQDVLVAPHQSELLYRGLVRHDLDVTLCLVEGLGHGFFNRGRLDDGPPRTMSVRQHRPGLGEIEEERVGPVFPLVEEFFRARLCAGGGQPGRTPGVAE
jgi:acetyl esterase/lipase